MLYSFYMHMDKSSELRAIRFAVEKSHGKDAIDFFVKIKDMVGAVLAIPPSEMIMDNVYIEPQELAQVFSAVYDGKMVNKMHMLTAVQSRFDARGISSGEFAAILLVDFIKTKEKEEASRVRLDNRQPLSSASKPSMARTTQKFSLNQPADQQHSRESSLDQSSPRRNTIDADSFSSPSNTKKVGFTDSTGAQATASPKKTTKKAPETPEESSAQKKKAHKESLM